VTATEPAGVYYCTAHNGIANEDQDTCDFYDSIDGDECIFHPCYYNPAETTPKV